MILGDRWRRLGRGRRRGRGDGRRRPGVSGNLGRGGAVAQPALLFERLSIGLSSLQGLQSQTRFTFLLLPTRLCQQDLEAKVTQDHPAVSPIRSHYFELVQRRGGIIPRLGVIALPESGKAFGPRVNFADDRCGGL